MANVGELIGKEAAEALSKGVKNSRKAVSKEASKTLNKTAKKAVEASDDIAKEISNKELRKKIVNARKTEQEFYNARAGSGNKAKSRINEMILNTRDINSEEFKKAFDAESEKFTHQQAKRINSIKQNESKEFKKFFKDLDPDTQEMVNQYLNFSNKKGSNIKDKINDIKENPTKNSAKKVNAGAEKSPLKNTLHKAMPMAVGGAIVFGLWNSRGQQSNAQLYGQAPMPGQGGY